LLFVTLLDRSLGTLKALLISQLKVTVITAPFFLVVENCNSSQWLLILATEFCCKLGLSASANEEQSVAFRN
jgi:hypothetical protein